MMMTGTEEQPIFRKRKGGELYLARPRAKGIDKEKRYSWGVGPQVSPKWGYIRCNHDKILLQQHQAP